MSMGFSVDTALDYLDQRADTMTFQEALSVVSKYIATVTPELRQLRRDLAAEVERRVDEKYGRMRMMVERERTNRRRLEDKLDRIHDIINGEGY